ncbi:transposase [Sphaerisporangium sp. NPDC004334]
MTRRRRQFSAEFKEEAVRMVLEGDHTVAAAREFGINASPRQLGESASDRARPSRAAGLRTEASPDPGVGAGERRAAREAGVLEKAAADLTGRRNTSDDSAAS